jgi:hypothetical protein
MRRKNRFLTDVKNAVAPEEIPGLAPHFDELSKDAYELSQAIPYPAKGTGVVYTERYFESLVPLLKQKPFPGSAEMFGGGHESASADFYTTGLKLAKNGDGTGTAYFRITIPPTDMKSASNEGLIRAVKNGAVEFSLIADVDEERENGKIVFNQEKGCPRNDAVDQGAMGQTVFANGLDEAELIALIQAGQICEVPGGGIIENGKVNRLVAVALQNDAEKSAFAGRLLNAIAERRKNKYQRGNKMTKQELLEGVKVAVDNNDLSLEDIAAYIDKGNKLKNADETEKLKILEAVRAALGLSQEAKPEQIKEAVEELLSVAEESVEALAETEANKLAKSSIKNGNAELEAMISEYAKKSLAPYGKKLLNKKTRESALEKLKQDKMLNYLRGQQAASAPVDGGKQKTTEGI